MRNELEKTNWHQQISECKRLCSKFVWKMRAVLCSTLPLTRRDYGYSYSSVWLITDFKWFLVAMRWHPCDGWIRMKNTSLFIDQIWCAVLTAHELQANWSFNGETYNIRIDIFRLLVCMCAVCAYNVWLNALCSSMRLCILCESHAYPNAKRKKLRAKKLESFPENSVC